MDNYDMKSRKFLRIATFFASAMLAAASHGWGFDSALKSVSGATQKVKEVNDVLQGEPAPAAPPEPVPRPSSSARACPSSSARACPHGSAASLLSGKGEGGARRAHDGKREDAA